VGEPSGRTFTSKGAFLLGVANPKAYLVFASLMGSFTLKPSNEEWVDVLLKWVLCVAVMIVVDLAWLGLGRLFGRVALKPAAERVFNVAMGLTIIAACAAAWL
jgi:threonine/homoserine/homoserine lactone efflux protein